MDPSWNFCLFWRNPPTPLLWQLRFYRILREEPPLRTSLPSPFRKCQRHSPPGRRFSEPSDTDGLTTPAQVRPRRPCSWSSQTHPP